MITKREHDSGACKALEAAGYGTCTWCELREKSAARVDEQRPEFRADPEVLKPREEWQR